jgi:hypothetical protein
MATTLGKPSRACPAEEWMPRKLKTYQTSIGFFDLAVAVPSMKAALEAWGAGRNLFHDGVAKESEDPDVIAAATAKPGVVLKRPVGSKASFKEHADLPAHLAGGGSEKVRHQPASPKKTHQKPTNDPAADRKAALAFEQEQRRCARERAKDEAARQKEHKRRQRAIEKSEAALEAARQRHQKNAANIQAEREALEKRSQAEEARWEEERGRLEPALRKLQ